MMIWSQVIRQAIWVKRSVPTWQNMNLFITISPLVSSTTQHHEYSSLSCYCPFCAYLSARKLIISTRGCKGPRSIKSTVPTVKSRTGWKERMTIDERKRRFCNRQQLPILCQNKWMQWPDPNNTLYTDSLSRTLSVMAAPSWTSVENMDQYRL